jgi:hypothetical protein
VVIRSVRLDSCSIRGVENSSREVKYSQGNRIGPSSGDGSRS